MTAILKFDERESGPGPSECTVVLSDCEGAHHEVILYDGSVSDKGFEVGVIGQSEEKTLIEFPRETTRGQWRAWVPNTALSK